jgi:ferric-dicitrate binding protein FerR (iron transport regulator)
MNENKMDRIFRDRLESITGLPREVSWNSETGWQDFEKQYLSKKIFVKKIAWYLVPAAALLLIIFSIFLFPDASPERITVSNVDKAIREVPLPDGNRIWLGRNSTLDYPSEINAKNNEIMVTGEVYIEFDRINCPVYRIRSFNAVIMVENKSYFNIRALTRAEHVDITVAEGAIKVQDASYDKGLTLLVPKGNYCSVHKSQNLVFSSRNTNENYLSWKTGRLTFNNTPVATVTEILSQYYHTDIELEDKSLALCRFSGIFKDQPMDNVLQKMEADLKILVRQAGDTVKISGNGCL